MGLAILIVFILIVVIMVIAVKVRLNKIDNKQNSNISKCKKSDKDKRKLNINFKDKMSKFNRDATKSRGNKDYIVFDVEEKDEAIETLSKGIKTKKDLISPQSIDRSNPDYLKVGGKYVRSFILEGYPTYVSVGWLDSLLNYQGDMDVSLYIMPADERSALNELTEKITQFEAQLSVEEEKGSIKHTTRLQNQIDKLYKERMNIEQNLENLYYAQIVCNLYCDSIDDLNKETQKLDNKLRGRKMLLVPSYLKQDENFLSALPYGQSFLPSKIRNLNSGAVSACFPFYNSEIFHQAGVFCGINMETDTLVAIDFYDRSLLYNSNITVFGESGSGKTFFISLLTLRSVLKGIRTAIIDPEGEYENITKALGGSYIKISASGSSRINPFDLEEEEKEDGTNKVSIKEKVGDVLNLVAVMSGGMTAEESSLISTILMDLYYKEFGFEDNPESLYIDEPFLDEKTGTFYDKRKKPMPTMSDFHKLLGKFLEKNPNEGLERIYNALKMFVKGGVYDIFDCQTSEDLQDFVNAPVITFDINGLEERILRPIGMYVALTWTWEKFAKKNPFEPKRVVVDEAWMLVSETMVGYEYTSAFLNNSARRIRKRMGGLMIASQNFLEFAENPQGRAVLTNALTNIFLKQSVKDIDAVQDTFKLSDGEKEFLLSAKKGEALIRINRESVPTRIMPFDYEKNLITEGKAD